MESTSSATLNQNPVKWGNQALLANQRLQATGTKIDDIAGQRDHIDFFHVIYGLADSTGDGGVLLTPNSSSSIKWNISLQKDRINKILPYPNEMIAFAVNNPRFLVGPIVSPLHFNEAVQEAIQWIDDATRLSQKGIGELIGVTRQTINRWERGEPIRAHNRRRLFAVRDVLKRASLRYSTPNELATWLDTPRGADGRTPAQLLEANEINRARLLAVTSPSPGLRQVPSWVNQPVPEAFRAGAERRQEALPPETDNELAHLIDEEEDNTDEDGEVLPPI